MVLKKATKTTLSKKGDKKLLFSQKVRRFIKSSDKFFTKTQKDQRGIPIELDLEIY